MPYRVPETDNNLRRAARALSSDPFPEQHMEAISSIRIGAQVYRTVAASGDLWAASVVRIGPEEDEDLVRENIISLGFDAVEAAEALLAAIAHPEAVPEQFISFGRPRKPLSPQMEQRLHQLDCRNVASSAASGLWQVVQPHLLMYEQPMIELN